ncbi:MAG: hypothetical protein ACXV8O_15690 [Methylobacter sp.]
MIKKASSTKSTKNTKRNDSKDAPPFRNIAHLGLPDFKNPEGRRSADFPPNVFFTEMDVKNSGYDTISDKSMADIFRTFCVFRGQCIASVIYFFVSSAIAPALLYFLRPCSRSCLRGDNLLRTVDNDEYKKTRTARPT